MRTIAPILVLAFVFSSIPGSAMALSYGVNYNWFAQHNNTCPTTETLSSVLPNYTTNRTAIRTQLQQMHANGIDSIRIFVGWGNDAAGVQRGDFVGAFIVPPTTVVPDAYFQNVKTFAIDLATYGINNVTFVLGGAGSYKVGICGNDLDGLVIPTFKSGLDKLLSIVVQGTYSPKPTNIQIDLANEIAPSNYEATCTYNQRVTFIQAAWNYYTSTTYGAQGRGATFSSTLDDSTDFRIAANRLNNLITAIGATGKPQPTWFEVHTYGTRSALVNMLRGVYQIYSDHQFLSNQARTKNTVIGETFYQDSNSALGIKDYLTSYDGYNGGRIGLQRVIEWPLQQPVGCTHTVNVPPPYSASVYSSTLN